MTCYEDSYEYANRNPDTEKKGYYSFVHIFEKFMLNWITKWKINFLSVTNRETL